MHASDLIDAQIAKLTDWRGVTITNIRKIIRGADPEIVEELKWMDTPVWSHDGIVCLAKAFKDKVKLTFYEGEPLDIELPTSVDLKVIKAEMAVRGDTATGVTKKVTVETGRDVQVPAFVNEGDTIRVDTRTGTYLTRV